MMIAKVHGGFEKLSGRLVYDPSAPLKSEVVVAIDATSINTREPRRDEHLKSADFFDVAKYPALAFKSIRVEKSEDGLNVVGNLSIRGITKEVSLAVEGPSQELRDPYGNIRIGVSATTRIQRKEFGLTWNAAIEAGGVLVGDDVSITLDIQFVKHA